MSAQQGSTDDLFPWETADTPGTSETPSDAGATHASMQESLALGGEPEPRPVATDDAAVAAEVDADTAVFDVDELDDDLAPPDVDADVVGDRASARPVAQKEYYSISEVCELVALKPHVLRYWETQFQVLNPSKNRSGNRVYQRKEIRLILLVKHLLYEEKYTVEGARAKLEQMRRGAQTQQSAGRALDRQMIGLLREELAQLARVLTLPT